jgi:glycosyltransferase involved in cell wall biosynthesis
MAPSQQEEVSTDSEQPMNGSACGERGIRVLMGSSYFASHNGGVERVAGELFHAFADRGQEMVWMAGDVTPPPEPVGRSRTASLRIFNFVEDKIGLPFPIPAPSALRQIVREVGNADILILHDCLYLSNILTFLTARWRRIPTIIIQHIGFIPYRNFLLNLVMRFANSVATRPMLSCAEQVVFISETTKKYFGNLHFKRVPELIFNGVDSDLYRPVRGRSEKPDLRRTYDLPMDRPVILYVGRFVEKKGIAVLKHMLEQRPHWIWAFAGWGPLDPSGWNSANVRVFSGLRGASLAALYRACDVLVLPSTGEGFPLVIQEALASGLPVVCGAESLRADQAMDAFVRGVRILPGDDARTARDFLRDLDDIVESKPELKPDPEQLRAFAASRYSWAAAIDRYLNILARLVPEPVSRTQGAQVSPDVVR